MNLDEVNLTRENEEKEEGRHQQYKNLTKHEELRRRRTECSIEIRKKKGTDLMMKRRNIHEDVEEESDTDLEEKASESSRPQSKRAKRDISTNVITTRGTDIDGLLNDDSLLNTAPGTSLLLEITAMYRTRSSLAFRVKGCDMVGFIGNGLSPIISTMAVNAASTSGNNDNKKKVDNEEGKVGRSSSASSNGRSVRGDSVAKDRKGEKQKGKKKKEEPSNEDVDEDSKSSDQYGYDKCEMKELDLFQYHVCHFGVCEKRFQMSQELEYHISKCHKKRTPISKHVELATLRVVGQGCAALVAVMLAHHRRDSNMVCESICTQTENSLFDTKDVGVETDDLSEMPVLTLEVPLEQPVGHVSEDLSDNDVDPKPTDLVFKQPSSAAAALTGIPQSSSSSSSAGPPPPIIQRSTPSTPISTKIGINPQMMAMAEKSKQQRNAMATDSPKPNQMPPASSIPSTSAQPPVLIQTHPIAGPQFIAPGFHPGMIHHFHHQMAAMDPRMAALNQVAALNQQQQQMSRTLLLLYMGMNPNIPSTSTSSTNATLAPRPPPPQPMTTGSIEGQSSKHPVNPSPVVKPPVNRQGFPLGQFPGFANFSRYFDENGKPVTVRQTAMPFAASPLAHLPPINNAPQSTVPPTIVYPAVPQQATKLDTVPSNPNIPSTSTSSTAATNGDSDGFEFSDLAQIYNEVTIQLDLRKWMFEMVIRSERCPFTRDMVRWTNKEELRALGVDAYEFRFTHDQWSRTRINNN